MMRGQKTLTASVKKRITEDWHSYFPELGVYSPMHLLKRHGPLLIGICLDQTSSGDIYRPTFHVDCLCKEFPVVTLTLATRLRTLRPGPDFIGVKEHEERVHDAAQRMNDQSLLPLQGSLHLAQVIDAYRKYLNTDLGQMHAPQLFQDMILLYIWSEATGKAQSLLNEVRGNDSGAKYENAGVEDETVPFRWEELIEEPRKLDRVVASQIANLGLNEIPTSELLTNRSDR